MSKNDEFPIFGAAMFILAGGAGYIAADLTPGIRGVGAATFAAVLLLCGVIQWLAQPVSK